MPKFTHLALHLFDPRLLGSGLARSIAAMTLDLTEPRAKAVRRATQFTRDRRSFVLIFIAVFRNQPHRTLAEPGGIRLRSLLLFPFHNGQFPESFTLR